MGERKLRINLQIKFITITLLIVLIFGVIMIITSYSIYRSRMMEKYTNEIKSIAATAAAMIDSESVEKYLSDFQKDEEYERLYEHFQIIQQNNKLSFLYSYVPDTAGLTVFVQGTSPTDEYHFDLGTRLTVNERYTQENLDFAKHLLIKHLLSNPEEDRTHQITSLNGQVITAYEIIYNKEGQIVLVVGADMSVDMLNRILREYMILFCSLAGLLIIVFIPIYNIFIRESVIKPIRVLSNRVKRFIETGQDEKGSLVALGLPLDKDDEIGELGRAFHKMSEDIVDYIDNFTNNALEKERIENELRYAEQSSEYKSRFLANMSHEIRTPMNVILGIAEIQLQEENVSAEMREALVKIYDSGNVLLHIINDILDLSKIEAGKLEIISAHYDIPSLINDAVQLTRMRYESKPIEFILEVDEDTPLNLIGDEMRIQQVLNNILSNAYKYTDKGMVKMSVVAESGEEEDDVTLVICVSDTGQGMTEEQISRIFDEYSRFNLDINRGIVGTGLGMSITRRLIELMDGEIIVESEAGKGSVFTVRIPQKRKDSLVCGKEMTEKLKGFYYKSTEISKKSQILREYMPYGSVLIVDDVESNIYVAKGMLMSYGLNIETASSGYEAIDKIEKGREYDIIFMDHMMPRMDGIEAVNIIRSMGYTRTIIALTANALVGQAEKFLQEGFEGFVSKPIDTRELNAVLNQFIRDKQPPQVIEEARQRQHMKGITADIDKSEDMLESIDMNQLLLMDAKNAIRVLEEIGSKGNQLNETDFITYEVTVHGMKSVFSNIGEGDLFELAKRLELASHHRNIAIMLQETPAFIHEMKSLIEKCKPAEEREVMDLSYLQERLIQIKKACEAFDRELAEEVINELLQRTWPDRLNIVLVEINERIINNSFGKAAKALQAAESLLKGEKG